LIIPFFWCKPPTPENRAKMMSGQDWNTVTLSKNNRGLQGAAKKQANAAAARKGTLQTEARYGAKQNKSAHSNAGVNAKKLEESEELKRK